jgi:D-alanyl-D-alanine carboxypeptidase (penicillin-binding protein 5/6)
MPALFRRAPLRAAATALSGALLVLIASAGAAQTQPLPMPAPPQLSARSFVLLDALSMQVIASRLPDERSDPASLTKLMTAYLTFGAIRQGRLARNQLLPVSERAFKIEGSRSFLPLGKQIAVDDLLQGMIVQSGNDATIVLAEGVAGSEESFVQLMNHEAQRLGMRNTNFVNSTGLTAPRHHSTASDLALLAAALVRDFPEFYPFYSQREFRFNHINQRNRNRLLWIDPTVDGMKTGYTDAAGWCLIASARRNGRRLISVILGAPTEPARIVESQRLLNYGFQFFDTTRLYEASQPISEFEVWKGSARRVRVGVRSDLFVTLPTGTRERLRAHLESRQPLTAPLRNGQEVGTLRLTLDGRPLAEYPVVALDDVRVGNILIRAWHSLRLLWR